jgi:hypothetical protein
MGRDTVEQILAKNLKALMEANARRGLGTQMAVAEATRHKGAAIDQTTVSRILRAEVKVQLDTLEAIARAFEVEPYQLLIPGLNPKNPQILRSLSPTEERLYKALEEARAKPGTQ